MYMNTLVSISQPNNRKSQYTFRNIPQLRVIEYQYKHFTCLNCVNVVKVKLIHLFIGYL